MVNEGPALPEQSPPPPLQTQSFFERLPAEAVAAAAAATIVGTHANDMESIPVRDSAGPRDWELGLPVYWPVC